MAIEIPRETRDDVVAALRKYFTEELESELGRLPAELLLDFMTKQLGPTIYNRAIADAQAFLQDKLIDLEGQLFE